MERSRSAPMLAAGKLLMGSQMSSKPELALIKRVEKGAALSKQDVQKLRRVEAALQDYQDEKQEIFKDRIEEMHICYDQARRKREELKALYEKRHQDVLRELSDMRVHADHHFRALIEKLKKYSERFEERVAIQTAEFIEACTRQHLELDKRNQVYEQDLFRLDGELAVEREECTTSLLKHRDELKKKIGEQGVRLQEMIVERKQGNQDFVERFREKFAEIKQRMAEEAEAREKKMTEERKVVKKRYVELNEDQKRKEVITKEKLEQLRQQLEFQREERTSAQGTIVGNMTEFMGQLEANIADNVAKQREASRHLMKISGLDPDELLK